MDEEYYKNIGFKCGLEIHQRLATKRKLFCSCRTTQENEKKVGVIERHQRAVTGELGAIDRSSAFESGKGRKFIYNLFDETTCLVDSDEEPPHTVGEDAVQIALGIASSLNAEMPDEIEPMRKGVVDGSDPSAFQRSMLVGYGGWLDVDERRINIPSIFLEEESSGIVGSTSETVEYNIDRLGIPLIEIDTGPEISSPSQAKRVALKIGLLLRLTGRVQRGIGTIRQDVNVSVRGGTRVEIKGVQDLGTMDLLVENEVKRQLNLIKIREELRKRKAAVGDIKDVTNAFKGTNAKIIGASLKSGGVVLAFRLSGFKDVIGREINQDRRLGSEISDYARMAGVKGIIHSDEDLSKYGIGEKELAGLGKILGLGSGDSFILVTAPQEIARRAIEFARGRSEMAVSEVPGETRTAMENGVTRFMRPIPGGSRMYPETDAMPIEAKSGPKRSAFGRIEVDAIAKRLENEIGNRQLAEQMLWSEELPLYEKLIGRKAASPEFVATILLDRFSEMRREGVDVARISDEILAYILGKYTSAEITKAGVVELLKHTPVSDRDVDRLVEQRNLRRIKGKELERLLKDFKGSNIAAEVMSKYRLNIDGEELNSFIKKARA
ncbi:MAG: Glu-tRNA(Gln) amidotransferase subunit GatE [Candidatus Micrarchaeota archaeon]|nr:Glu-tRNA(Gln) amidotransferase subunit GatE [Candidatus Micrarchaeota archaeon]